MSQVPNGSLAGQPKELPLTRDTLWFVTPSIYELEARPDREVTDDRRYDHLAGRGEAHKSRRGVNPEPPLVTVDHFDLARVKPSS